MNWKAPQKSHPEADAAGYTSLGLKALLDIMQQDRKHFILDLGPALDANVTFWSRFPCRIFIEDFYRSYRSEPQFGAEAAGAANMEELLCYSGVFRFDIILAWDLLNYLDQDELGRLVRCLSPACQPGTLLFALISSHPEMPEKPCTFKILDPQRMSCETHTENVRPCPRYHPKDLARHITPFQVSSSYLLRNGIQEYVFVCR